MNAQKILIGATLLVSVSANAQFGGYPGGNTNLYNINPVGIGLPSATIATGISLDIAGGFDLRGQHLVFNSSNAIINWGSSGSGDLYFRRLTTQGSFGSGYNTYMLIKNNGNVGIGTSASSPYTQLQVGGDIVASTSSTTPTSAALLHANTTWSAAGSPDFTWISNTNTGLFHPAANVIGVSSNGTEMLRVTSTGVGIGTTSPAVKFQVGNSFSRATISDVAGNSQYWTSYMGMNLLQTATNQWTTVTDGTNNGGAALISDLNGNMGFYVFKTNSQTQPMSDATVATMMAMRLRNTGRLVIGPKELNSSSPYENDVNMPTRLSVDGRIVAKDLVVSLTDFWPDYVFENNYTLMPLDQLNQYIKNNGHLPGVKPAAELETNGISVSETSKVQMEKIEELTLYMLQLDEKIKKLEQENETLKKTISEQQH